MEMGCSTTNREWRCLPCRTCAVTRDQQTVGAYIDDTTITAQIKSRFFEKKEVAGTCGPGI